MLRGAMLPRPRPAPRVQMPRGAPSREWLGIERCVRFRHDPVRESSTARHAALSQGDRGGDSGG